MTQEAATRWPSESLPGAGSIRSKFNPGALEATTWVSLRDPCSAGIRGFMRESFAVAGGRTVV